MDVKRIVQVVKDVEEKYTEIKGAAKKDKAVELINDFVDIPLLPESMEAKLIGVAVDCLVAVFNELVWKKVAHVAEQ